MPEADREDCNTIACAIDIFDSNRIAGTHAYASIALVTSECAENLHYLTAQFEGNQAIAVYIETRHRLALRHYCRLERLRRLRLESEQRVENRAYDHRLER